MKYVQETLAGIFVLFAIPFWCIWMLLVIPLPADFYTDTHSTVFLSRGGEQLGQILSDEEEKKHIVEADAIAPYFLQAVIATEDADFFEHSGIDITATLRAMRDNILTGKIVSGASTLSQQVAKNYLHHQERTVGNKVQETLFALRLEKHLTKEEILTEWTNRVSFGSNIVGVEAAAQDIFGKSALYLDLAEASFLAGIPQSPTRLNPWNNFHLAKQRQEYVLQRMYEEGFITDTQRNVAQSQELVLSSTAEQAVGSHFIQFVHQQFEAQMPATIITTLDFQLQTQVSELLQHHLRAVEYNNISNAAVLVWELTNGEILTYVGSADFYNEDIQGQVDILTARRAVGSTLKPFLYLLAFQELDWNPETLIADEPTAFGTDSGFFYEPQNYDLAFRGDITIRQALAESRNVPAVKTLQQVGEQAFFSFLASLGIDTRAAQGDDFGLSSALGSFSITPLELAHAYGVLARGGKDFVFQYLASSSSTSFNHEKQITDCQQAFQIIDILSDNDARVNAFGTKNPLVFPYAVAAKTGTTRNFRDNWTVGFTDQIGVLVWVGNADGSPMRNVSGITGAGPLFAVVMDAAMQGRSKQQAFTTEGICGEEKAVEEIANDVGKTTTTGLRVFSPLPGQRFRIDPEKPLESQKLQFRANTVVTWSVNGEGIGEGEQVLWVPEQGRMEVVANDGGEQVSAVITVQ